MLQDSDMATKQEDVVIPIAAFVKEEDDTPLITYDGNQDDIEYNNYLETHKTKLNEIGEAVKWILRNRFERHTYHVSSTYETGISLKGLHKNYQCICYYERFVYGLYARHKNDWFSKEERDLIDEVVLTFTQSTSESKLVVHAHIYKWDKCSIFLTHLCCCFCPIKLFRYYNRA